MDGDHSLIVQWSFGKTGVSRFKHVKADAIKLLQHPCRIWKGPGRVRGISE